MSLVMTGASLALAGAALAGGYVKRRYDQQETASKTWATFTDVDGWGMLGERKMDDRNWPVPAFVYGSMRAKSDLLFDWPRNGVSRHALISMPSGAGKTWTTFYPTLMFGWTHSCVVHVRKKEMADLTAGWRSQFSDVIWLDPTSMGSARYNPLDRLRVDGIYAIRDTQNFIENLSTANGQKGGGDNAVFVETAKDFATGAVIYWLTHERRSMRNLSGLRVAFSDCKALAQRMMENEHPHPHVRGEIKITANSLLNNPSERFVGNVEALMRSWLRVYQDTVLATVTSCSDFTPEDLVAGRRPVTLFVHLPPSDDERLAPFVNLLISQIIDDLMTWEKTTRGGSAKRWQLAWILDEAWRLGKIRALEGALADMRSYGMRALLGFQGLSQVIDLYGPHNSVFNNCRWVTGWQNGFDECKHVADMLGEEERDKRSTSTSMGVFGDPKGSSSTRSTEWRPVVQAAHVSNLPKDRIVVFGEEKPILARRTHPDAWQKLIREVERPERFRGEFIPGPTVPPPVVRLSSLRLYLPAPAQRLLPPPPGDSPPSDGGGGGSSNPPPPPKKPRRRL